MNTSVPPLLRVEQLQLQLGSHHWTHQLQVDAGEILVIMGNSGCGKTSLLEGLAGFLPAVSGRILVQGQPVERLPVDQRPFSLLFQQHNFFEHLTVEQNLRLGFANARPKAESWQKLLAACQTLQLPDCLHSLPGQLSGGQRQRLALIRTVLRPQPVVLLDEPFSALDASLRDITRNWLKQQITEQQQAVLLVTHMQEDADQLADQILLL